MEGSRASGLIQAWFPAAGVKRKGFQASRGICAEGNSGELSPSGHRQPCIIDTIVTWLCPPHSSQKELERS